MKLWGSKIGIVACIERNKGKFIFVGNYPALPQFTGTFNSLEEAKAARIGAEKIVGGPRCNAGFWQGEMTWRGREVA